MLVCMAEQQRDRERQWWDRLIDSLNTWASAAALVSDRIGVVLSSEGRTRREVQIVMSPREWAEIHGVAYGDFDQAVADVRRALDDVPDGHGFLVYNCYELHPSMTDTLPEDPEVERLRELMRQHPEGLGGTWVAYTSDGTAHPCPEMPPLGER